MAEAEARLPPATARISAEARALLAELGAAGAVSARPRATPSGCVLDPPQAMILVPPRDDPKAAAFAELLNHLEDDADTESRDATDNGPDDALGDAVGGAVDFDMELDERESDAHESKDIESDARRSGLGGIFALLRRSGDGAVRRLVGAKDAAAAYNAQSGGSLLPFTVLRTVVLVFVAAVPPLVNLVVIQPQISDNNRKITETRNFETSSAKDEKIADKLAENVSLVERRSARLMETLMPEEKLEGLVNGFMAALQRYGMDLQSYNVTPDKSRKVVIGDLVQDASVLEMNLVGRYDVYSEIRRVFVAQSKTITVLDEHLRATPGQIDLAVKARLMVPVRRPYDGEVDIASGEGKP